MLEHDTGTDHGTHDLFCFTSTFGEVTIIAAIILVLFFYWFVGRIGERMARNELQLQQMAIQDGLTGLYNRRQFNLTLQDSIAMYTRYGRPVSLLMIDIDHFKQVNDTYGIRLEMRS